ncbi:hypothetical protein QYE76_048488 [Lolium multiflorum]|uniref:Uncharacterized protein n=1 Tax=Lolium multiflorum TaxID=4521 RepID=A0AAD8SMF9_LOLMU|nr:hypothetical protein QYE76_048488 [Lolium multiflorum]
MDRGNAVAVVTVDETRHGTPLPLLSSSPRLVFPTIVPSRHRQDLANPIAPSPSTPCPHDTIGGPMALSSHPVLKYHVEHLDFMLHETQKELDNARVYANQTHMALAHHADAIKMLAKDRKSLRLQRAKKDATIARLRAMIVSLEATVKAQEDQLREMEEEGEDIQGGEAFMSDDEDFEGDEFTDEEDYEFLEAGEDGFIPIDVDDDEEE